MIMRISISISIYTLILYIVLVLVTSSNDSSDNVISIHMNGSKNIRIFVLHILLTSRLI